MEELYKKDLHDPDSHDDVITHLEPDILECEVKWALESITRLLCPWNFPGKNTGVGCHFLLQGIFPIQRMARKDRKVFLSEQCKEIEENNRMRKTRDFFKKIRYSKGTFHANWAQ